MTGNLALASRARLAQMSFCEVYPGLTPWAKNCIALSGCSSCSLELKKEK